MLTKEALNKKKQYQYFLMHKESFWNGLSEFWIFVKVDLLLQNFTFSCRFNVNPFYGFNNTDLDAVNREYLIDVDAVEEDEEMDKPSQLNGNERATRSIYIDLLSILREKEKTIYVDNNNNMV